VALCNRWTTNVEKAQNLLVALEGAAAETVRGLTAEKDADYDAIWEICHADSATSMSLNMQNASLTQKDNLNLRLSLCSKKGCDQFSLLTLR